jgi:hypothetical protein
MTYTALRLVLGLAIAVYSTPSAHLGRQRTQRHWLLP